MAQSVVYGISVDSKVNTLNITAFVVQSVIIQNLSGDNVIFDNTVDPLLVIPPGVTAPINIYHLIYTLRFRTATNTTGYVMVTLLDSQQDVSKTPPLQQLPGTVTISGSVGIPSAVTVSGNVTNTPAQGSNQNVTVSGGSVTVTGGSITIVNSGPIATMGPSGIWAYYSGLNVSQVIALTRQSQMIMIQPYIGTLSQSGLMTVYTVDPVTGQIINLLIRETFQYSGTLPTNLDTIPYEFPGSYPVNSALHYSFTGNMGVMIGY